MTDIPTKPALPPEPRPDQIPESAFDLWLNRGLHQLFDDVANEPIPDDLMKLILEDKNK